MKTFKKCIPRFCRPAQRWAKKQPNLRTAWAKCPRGAWMVWWLHAFRNVPIPVVAAHLGGVYLGVDAFNEMPKKEAKDYADRVRKAFTCSGRLRRRRG